MAEKLTSSLEIAVQNSPLSAAAVESLSLEDEICRQSLNLYANACVTVHG